MSSFLLLTGMPGCGKTTMVQKIIHELKTTSAVVKLQGFYTEEVRNSSGERIGFDVVSLDGNRGILSRVSTEIKSSNRPKTGMKYKVGKYIVYVREFEDICMNLIESASEHTLLVIDEIGKMELFSERFETAIKNLLTNRSDLKVIATVPLKSPTNLIEQLKTCPKSQLFHITKSNRDEIFQNVLQAAQKLVS